MPLFGYVAPYRSQAKSVAWDYLKYFSRPITKQSNEADLIIELLNGAKIRLFGADNADAMRGLGFDGLYLDEYGDFKPSVWGNVVRPALSDKQGWCVFGGTPKGKNQFWNIYETSKKLPNEWFSLSLPASKSKLLPESELQAAQAQLAEDQYLQEYECSFEAAIIGAIWGTEMRKVSEDGRITKVENQIEVKTHTAWDLGHTDDTAIWWYQVVAGEIHIVDFFALSGGTIEEFVTKIKEKPYNYGKHYLPHDARARTLASGGKSVIEQMAAHLGINNLAIVPSLTVQDGIQAVRMALPRCWFDADQREYDEDKKAFRQTPKHDWTSHPADAMRMLAISWREEPKDKPPDPSKVLIVGPENEVTMNDMWAIHKQTARSNRI
jgi:hypothetical protein